MTHDTIPLRLLERARARGDDPAYLVKADGAWRATSWSAYAAEVVRAAKALVALGFEPGQTVALIAANRPEWAIFMLAAVMAGGRGAGIYTTSSAAETQFVLEHAEARFVLVDGAPQFETVRGARPALPHLQRALLLRESAQVSDPLALPWRLFLELGARVPDNELTRRMEALGPESVATLVYTSGAEGAPQGVLLSHRNLIWIAETVGKVLRIGAQDRSLSYLPLSHISEQLLTVHGPITTGSAVYYAESLRSAPDNLREVQPTLLFGVPRIWEKLHAGMQAELELAEGPRASLLKWAQAVARRVVEARSAGKEPALDLGLQYELAEALTLAKIKRSLGLANARVCLSGAAPLSAQTLAFFASLGIQILEVYGQSESAGPIALNQPHRTRFGSVGPKLPGISLKIAEDGEVLAAGPNLFLGYHRDPGASGEALRGGYLHTGDLGALDREGFLSLAGRKRELLVTTSGKNIAPKPIEAALRDEPLVRDAALVGDGRPFLGALISIDERAAHALGLSGALHENALVRERIEQHIQTVNQERAKLERIERYAILPRTFSVDTGELTPTLELRRHRIEELWAQEIEQLYGERTPRSGQRSDRSRLRGRSRPPRARRQARPEERSENEGRDPDKRRSDES